MNTFDHIPAGEKLKLLEHADTLDTWRKNEADERAWQSKPFADKLRSIEERLSTPSIDLFKSDVRNDEATERDNRIVLRVFIWISRLMADWHKKNPRPEPDKSVRDIYTLVSITSALSEVFARNGYRPWLSFQQLDGVLIQIQRLSRLAPHMIRDSRLMETRAKDNINLQRTISTWCEAILGREVERLDSIFLKYQEPANLTEAIDAERVALKAEVKREMKNTGDVDKMNPMTVAEFRQWLGEACEDGREPAESTVRNWRDAAKVKPRTSKNETFSVDELHRILMIASGKSGPRGKICKEIMARFQQ